jgi:protocatechuate 3,4-dioxygenase, alpha subunit
MTDASVPPTPGQTVGPFFHYALPYDGDSSLVPGGSTGAVRLHGYVFDGAGQPVPDALLEIRQADASGHVPTVEGSRHRDGRFTGWGRAATDASGHYGFVTVEPGPTRPGAAPFFAVTVLARGLLDRLFTRAYLPDDVAGLQTDPVLAALTAERRDGLVARREPEASLRFDVHLQGPQETAFLRFPRHGGSP